MLYVDGLPAIGIRGGSAYHRSFRKDFDRVLLYSEFVFTTASQSDTSSSRPTSSGHKAPSVK